MTNKTNAVTITAPKAITVSILERERKILLDLGNDLTKVREKNDLICLFSSGIKGLFNFSHAIVTLIDPKTDTYAPFLLDPVSSAIKDHPAYDQLVGTHFSLHEPFIQAVLQQAGPSSYIMEEVMNAPGSPYFLKVNYEGGVREILMTPLKSGEQTIGFLHVYAKNTTSFTPAFKSIINGIAPQISSAVTNIIKNEEIRQEETVKETLLNLSNNMAKVRDRRELLQVINAGLKKMLHFSHSMMTVSDEDGVYYKAYTDDLPDLVFSLPTPMEDGIHDMAELYYQPLSFDLSTFDMEKVPAWLKHHYDAGAKEMIVKILAGDGRCRYSLILFADELHTFNDVATGIIQRISSQLFTAARNIAATEEILERENEKSFLLDFSSDLAAVRSKEDFAEAVRRSLKKLNPLRGYMIRKLNEDQVTMSTYIYDASVTTPGDPAIQEMIDSSFPVNDGLQDRVLNSEIPLLFSVNTEINRGHTPGYLLFWQKMGFRTVLGMPLRSGNTQLGILWLGIEDINMPLLQGICAQISIAMHNIMANEELVQKEQEQAFLLNFSNDVASVKTRDDLQAVISSVLRRVLNTKLAMVRIIEDDGVTLSPYMYDESVFASDNAMYRSMAGKNIDIHEELSARVLQHEGPVIFDVEEERRQGNTSAYITLWHNTGFAKMFAAPLRVGNVNIGTLWLLTNEIHLTILKGICAQVSIAISNIRANDKLMANKQNLEHENDYLKEQIQTIYNFSEIVGSGVQMQKVYRLMSQVAESSSTVLLLGETGTGKELIARALHNASSRKNKLMVKVNCAALPVHLIESELFGHEKGAFTGAIDRRIGKFELANNSTLFLDEIGEMPLELQVKLLRVLQERELERIGGKNTIKVDVRIIAATNRNLETEVQAGRFRADLYYRLNVFPIGLPPLRERPEDIEPLANFFISKFNKNTGKRITGVSPKVLQQLRSYDWPGNVRELEHLVERSILLCDGHVLREIHLPGAQDTHAVTTVFSTKTLEEMERAYIVQILKRCSGKISGAGGAAALLEVPGTTLHSKIKKLGITKADYFN